MVLPELPWAELERQIGRQHEDRRPALVICTIILLVSATFTVFLRLLARRMQGLRLAWNDWTIVICLILTAAMCAVNFYAISIGFGRHVVLLGANRGMELAKLFYIQEIIFPATNCSVKVSILLLYHSIFGASKNRNFNRGIRITMSLWIILSIVATISLIFQCVPIPLAWSSNHSSQCFDLEKFALGITIFAVFLNVATLVLPTPLIWQLKLTRPRKIGVTALFMLGGADVAVSIVRAIETKHIDPTIADISWDQCISIMLLILEPTLGIICACVPVLRPVFRKVFVTMVTKTGCTSAGQTDGSYSKTKSLATSATIPFVMMFSQKGEKSGLDSIDKEHPFYDDCETPLPVYSKAYHKHTKSHSAEKKRHTKKSTLTSSASVTLNSQSPMHSTMGKDDDMAVPYKGDLNRPSRAAVPDSRALAGLHHPGTLVSHGTFSPVRQSIISPSTYQSTHEADPHTPSGTQVDQPFASPTTLIGSPRTPGHTHQHQQQQLHRGTASPIVPEPIYRPSESRIQIPTSRLSDAAQGLRRTEASPTSSYYPSRQTSRLPSAVAPSSPHNNNINSPTYLQPRQLSPKDGSVSPFSNIYTQSQSSFQSQAQRPSETSSSSYFPPQAMHTNEQSPQGLRRPSQTHTYSSDYAPSPTQGPGPASPHAHQARQAQSPRYVKSPLTDPNARLHIGVPRRIDIKAPRSAYSISSTNSHTTSNIITGHRQPKSQSQSTQPMSSFFNTSPSESSASSYASRSPSRGAATRARGQAQLSVNTNVNTVSEWYSSPGSSSGSSASLPSTSKGLPPIPGPSSALANKAGRRTDTEIVGGSAGEPVNVRGRGAMF